MAAIGSVGAYATDAPVQDAITPALQFQQQMAFKNAEKEQERKDKIAQAKALADKDYNVPEMKTEYSGFASDDAMRLDWGNKAKETILNSINNAKAGKISKQQQQTIQANIMAGLDYLNSGAKNITTQATNMATAVKDKKVFTPAIDEALNLGGAYENRRVEFEIDPTTGASSVITKDKQGNTILKEGLEKVGSQIYNPISQVDFQGMLTKFKANNEMDVTQKIYWDKTTKKTEVTPRLLGSIDRYADAELANKDVLINAYYNATKEYKKEITAPKDIETAKRYIVDTFVNSYKKENIDDPNFEGANYALKKAKSEKENTPISTIVTTPTYIGKAGDKNELHSLMRKRTC